MKKLITVKTLVTVNDLAHFDACTLCLKSFRVGWPTAEIEVTINGPGDILTSAEVMERLRYMAKDELAHNAKNALLTFSETRIHLADWIRQQTQHPYPGPLVIADPDIVYWKSCEDWEFPESVLLAGYYNPRMWNDFAGCISVPRIHTSMMVFPDVQKLHWTIEALYPQASAPAGEYCPCDPFAPAVRFENGLPTYWDCCANLYNMLACKDSRSIFLHHFGEKEKACFDHLNSASFHDIMVERMGEKHREGFIRAHRDWVKNPSPGLWPLVDAYYKEKEIEGWVGDYGIYDRTLKV